jgi:hypothetical protein
MELLTVAQKVKQFGAKVKKDGLAGYYIYIGKNITVKFNAEECEDKYWAINTRGATQVVKELAGDWNRYETKNDLVWDLLNLW